MSDVTLKLEWLDVGALRELLLDRPQREQWSARVLAELDAAVKTAAEELCPIEPQSLRA